MLSLHFLKEQRHLAFLEKTDILTSLLRLLLLNHYTKLIGAGKGSNYQSYLALAADNPHRSQSLGPWLAIIKSKNSRLARICAAVSSSIAPSATFQEDNISYRFKQSQNNFSASTD